MATGTDGPPFPSAFHPPSAPFTTEDEIRDIGEAFERGAMAGTAWNHRAHLLAALWLLCRYGPDEGGDRVRVGIQRLNKANGIPQTPTGGYHETITRFYLAAIARHLRDAPKGASIADVATAVLATWGDKNRPLEYYSRDRLFSWEARTGWVEPDLKALE